MLERLADVDKFLEILPAIRRAAHIFLGVIFLHRFQDVKKYFFTAAVALFWIQPCVGTAIGFGKKYALEDNSGQVWY